MTRKQRWVVVLLIVAAAPRLALPPCVQTARDDVGWVRTAVSLNDIGTALQSYHEQCGEAVDVTRFE